jgi:dopamine receptor D2
MSVYRERCLQTVTNYFIVSLAIADIMVAVLVMPLAVYVEVKFNLPRIA